MQSVPMLPMNQPNHFLAVGESSEFRTFIRRTTATTNANSCRCDSSDQIDWAMHVLVLVINGLQGLATVC